MTRSPQEVLRWIRLSKLSHQLSLTSSGSTYIQQHTMGRGHEYATPPPQHCRLTSPPPILVFNTLQEPLLVVWQSGLWARGEVGMQGFWKVEQFIGWPPGERRRKEMRGVEWFLATAGMKKLLIRLLDYHAYSMNINHVYSLLNIISKCIPQSLLHICIANTSEFGWGAISAYTLYIFIV